MNVIKMQPKERRQDPFHEMVQKYVEGEYIAMYVTATASNGEIVTVEVSRPAVASA